MTFSDPPNYLFTTGKDGSVFFWKVYVNDYIYKKIVKTASLQLSNVE